MILFCRSMSFCPSVQFCIIATSMASSMDATKFPVADEFTVSSLKPRRNTLFRASKKFCDKFKSCFFRKEICVRVCGYNGVA
jgi:hypothetical protein